MKCLEEIVRNLYTTDGITTFYTGGALGWDTLAARAVIEVRKELPDVRLILVLPCKDQAKRWKAADREVYDSLNASADEVACLAEHYYRGCMFLRNRCLVDHSSVCVCYQAKDNAGSFIATVGGLDEIAYTITGDVAVTITLTVTSDAKADTLDDPAEFRTGKNAISVLPAASGKDLVFLNLQLTKTVDGVQQDIGDTNTQLLTIILPFDTAGKSGITVFRYHGGTAQAMTQDPAAGEEGFVVGSNTVTIYAKGFSAYAIGYDIEDDSSSDDDSGSYSGGGSSGSSGGGSSSGGSGTVTICSDLDPKAWYYADTVAALEKGFMEGCEKGLFRPNEDTTRATIAQILWNLAGKPVSDADIQFSDVNDTDWFAPAVRWAAAQGIIEGWNGRFFPNDLVNREQVAVMLYRYAKTQGQGFEGLWSFQLTHADAEKVSDWAYEALCWLTMKEVIRGRSATTLVPQGIATRAEIAAIFNRYLSLEK